MPHKFHTLTHTIMTTMFTLNLYKDEFNAEFLYQINRGVIEGIKTTGFENSKVIKVEGTAEDLERLGEVIFCDDEEKIKSVFPSFITKEDYKNREREVFAKTYDNLLRELAGLAMMGCTYTTGEEFRILYDTMNTMESLRFA